MKTLEFLTGLEQEQGKCMESRQIARIASHIRDDDRFEPA